MYRILILSNGHGEDLSGSLLGKELQNKGHIVNAMPLVGKGYFYNQADIRLVGQQKEFTTGGLGYTSFQGRIKEIYQGQFIHLVRNIIRLLFISNNYDFLLVIGDVLPVLASWLTKLPVVVYLVAYSSHYEGRLNLPWPSKLCLRSKRFLSIYSRDKLTADDLSQQLNKAVRFLGNPFMDQVRKKSEKLVGSFQRIGILPGSRMPELKDNLLSLLNIIIYLPEKKLINNQLAIDIALIRSLDNQSLSELVNPFGWKLYTSVKPFEPDILKLDNHKVNVYRDSFVQVLQSSDVILAMAGTATEQAVGLSKPVVQFPGKGPQFTSAFADAQRRLLGPTVFCANPEEPYGNKFQDTAQIMIDLLDRVSNDSFLRLECQKQAECRLGIYQNSSHALINDILINLAK